MLRRYWIEFVKSKEAILPIGISNGCGISAYDYDDAIKLLKEKVFVDIELPSIKKIIEDVDVSTLDTGHVLPNMGNVAVRGVWFPLGY